MKPASKAVVLSDDAEDEAEGTKYLELWTWNSNERKWMKPDFEIDIGSSVDDIAEALKEQIADEFSEWLYTADGVSIEDWESLEIVDKTGKALIFKGIAVYDEENPDTGNYRPCRDRVAAIVNVDVSPRKFIAFRKFIKDLVTAGCFGK